MLEKLAGRLSWEQTGQGIRVHIPAQRESLVIRILSLIVWSVAWWLFLHNTLGRQNHPHARLIWLLVWGFGVLLVSYSALRSLIGVTTVSLDANQILIASHLVGFQLNARSYSNAAVRSLRFVPTKMHVLSDRSSGIWFIENNRLREFASGLTEAEAVALIDRMLQVYKFPIDKAWTYNSTAS
jgi:hypothetical protein